MSGLHLNLAKTTVIPLDTVDLEAWRAQLLATAPAWQGVQICSWGTYLGFAVGPGKKDRSWRKGADRLQQRA